MGYVELRYYRKFWRTLFTGPLGAHKRSGLLESSIVAQLGGSLREIQDTGVPKEEMVCIVPEILAGVGSRH